MQSLAFVSDLAWFLGVGALITAVFLRLRLPVLLGYLLAGLLLGPQGPFASFLTHPANVEILGQLGIIFLLFFLGTEFHLRKLKSLGPAPLLAGVLELTLMLSLGFEAGRLMGLETAPSLFLGAMLCMCSTTILVKSLNDQKLMKEDFASFVVGLTLVEDLATVLILIFVSGWSERSHPGIGPMVSALGKVTAFTALTLALGLGLVPRLLKRLDRQGNLEILALAAIGFGVVLSALAGHLGFSTALGAFLSGMVMADSGVMPKIQERLSTLRDLFVALFFISVGFQADFSALGGHWGWTLAALAVVLVGKVLSVTASALLIGLDARTALRSGLAMAHVGEFSFVVAALGIAQGALPAEMMGVVVAASTATMLTTPFFMRHGGAWADKLESRLPSGAKTFLARYQSWLKALHWPLQDLKLPRNLYPLALRAGMLVLLLASLGPSLPWVRRTLRDHFYPENGAESLLTTLGVHHAPDEALGPKLAVEIGFFLAFLVLFLLFLNTLKRLFRHLLMNRGESMDRKGQTLLALWMFVSAAVTAALFLAEASPFVSPWTLLAVLAGVALYLFGGLTRAMALMDDRLDHFVDQLIKTAEGAVPSDRASLQTLLTDRYPLSAVVMDFMMPPTPTAANRTLAELRLRKATGATILSVYRGETNLTNPSPDFQILPGDVLCLLGEKEHVQGAFAYLNELCRKPPEADSPDSAPQLETLQVPPGSPLAGKTLRDLSLRSLTAATVVGLDRGGSLTTSPAADTPLAAGDILLVLGSPEALKKADKLIQSGGPSPEASTLEEQSLEAELRG